MPQKNVNGYHEQDDKASRPSRPAGPGVAPAGRGRFMLWFLLSIILLFWTWSLFNEPQAPQVDYSTFREQLKQGNVERVTVQGQQIQGTLREPAMRTAAGDTAVYDDFITHLPSFGDEQLLPLLEEHEVAVETQPPMDFSWWPILLALLPFIFMIWIGLLIFRRMQAQGQHLFSIRKSRAKLYDRERAVTRFDDVAGAEEAKRELEEIVTFLKRPEHIQRLGGEVPRGVLLVGPPGTGKTLLARAIAGEAGVPFYSITGSDFMEMFVGVGASRVRDLFEEAKKESPAIIFIDELDSIGRQRGAGLGGGHDEREQTLNQLLSEMDGFEANHSVIVVAATNRPDILDPALLRPGRFDRRIIVDLPTSGDRLEILRIHAQNKPLAGSVDLERLARGTPGFSGADLENLLNEAALLAARKDQQEILEEDVEAARDKVLMGLERSGVVLTEEERSMLAYHEAGHALVAAVLPSADPIHKVTIIPRGRAMGVTQQLPDREKYIYRKEYMLDRLAVMMGGRAAEELIFETATSGAENDLKQVIQLARKMVLDWGMSERFRNVAFGGSQRGEVFLGDEIGRYREYSETTAREIDEEVRIILEAAFDRARQTLVQHRTHLDRIAEALLDKEEIPGRKVLEILGKQSAPAASS